MGYAKCVQLLAKAIGDSFGAAVIFFHGYNTSFDDAVRRAIGFSRDLEISVPVLVWSWPSLGRKSGYNYDRDGVEFSRPYLKEFAKAFLTDPSINQISIVAHSMGGRFGVNVLEISNELAKPVSNIVFIAPDVPQSIFKQNISLYAANAGLTTLYANQHDRALIGSSYWNGQPPAGLAGRHLLVMDGLDTIDVSLVDNSGIELNHTHGFDVPPVAKDVKTVLVDRLNAALRGLPSAMHNNRTYWLIRP